MPFRLKMSHEDGVQFSVVTFQELMFDFPTMHYLNSNKALHLLRPVYFHTPFLSLRIQ